MPRNFSSISKPLEHHIHRVHQDLGNDGVQHRGAHQDDGALEPAPVGRVVAAATVTRPAPVGPPTGRSPPPRRGRGTCAVRIGGGCRPAGLQASPSVAASTRAGAEGAWGLRTFLAATVAAVAAISATWCTRLLFSASVKPGMLRTAVRPQSVVP